MYFEEEIDKSSFRVVSGHGDLCESLACDTICEIYSSSLSHHQTSAKHENMLRLYSGTTTKETGARVKFVDAPLLTHTNHTHTRETKRQSPTSVTHPPHPSLKQYLPLLLLALYPPLSPMRVRSLTSVQSKRWRAARSTGGWTKWNGRHLFSFRKTTSAYNTSFHSDFEFQKMGHRQTET